MAADGEIFWMIVNTEDLINSDRLRDRNRPQKIHWELRTAMDEITRLQQKNPHGEYYLLSASHFMRQNLAGVFSLVETEQNFLSLRAR